MSTKDYYQDNNGLWVEYQAEKNFEDYIVLYEDDDYYDDEGCWHEPTEVKLSVQGPGMPSKPTYENMSQFDNGRLVM